MGSSAKKKKDKKKDFQKPKLKVGKIKPKASNFTDTSFKAKSIVVNRQSISVTAPTASAQFAHHVSLLKNRSDTQRAESLAFITSAVSATRTGASLPEPVAVFLPKILPLCLDGSSAVRQQLLKLLRVMTARSGDARAQAESALLYIHAAMSHLSADIRGFSVDVLDWLLDCAGPEAVGCAGGWVKTLDCFMSLFGWTAQEPASDMSQKRKGWSSVQRAGARPGAESRTMARQLAVFARFLDMGIRRHTIDVSEKAVMSGFPLWDVQQHLLPVSANPFAHLNLFGRARDDGTDMLEDSEDRQRVFRQRYGDSVHQGAELLIKEGGELGRSAAGVKKALAEGLRGIDFGD